VARVRGPDQGRLTQGDLAAGWARTLARRARMGTSGSSGIPELGDRPT
jgi:hypothetical protein